jgi:D-threo-aldose 1-dehydrogenase
MPAGRYTLLDQSVLDDVLPAAAIAFPHTHPSIINLPLGKRTAEQVGRNVELHDQQVPDGLWDDLRTQQLIRSAVLAGHGGGSDAWCL